MDNHVTETMTAAEYQTMQRSDTDAPGERPDTVRMYLGVDPGKQTGLALWVPSEDRLILPPAKSFFDALSWAAEHADPACTVCVVEDPTQNKPIFNRGVSGRRNLKIAQNVGSNKRSAQLTIKGLLRRGFYVRRVRPTSAKWSKETLERMTGYTGRSSQHARDAAKLVYNLG